MNGRTCVVCRKTGCKAELLRFVLSPGRDGAQGENAGRRLELDLEQIRPGRGVYCHADPECLFQKKLWGACAASLERSQRAQERKKLAGGERPRGERKLVEVVETAVKELQSGNRTARRKAALQRAEALLELLKRSSETPQGKKPQRLRL